MSAYGPRNARYSVESVPIHGGARYHQRRARAVRRDVFLELAGDERLLCNKRPLGVLRGLRLEVGRCTSGELLGLVVRLEPHICARSALLLLCCHPVVRHGHIEDFRDYISFSLPQSLQTIERHALLGLRRNQESKMESASASATCRCYSLPILTRDLPAPTQHHN